jgi:hypothetical protein
MHLIILLNKFQYHGEYCIMLRKELESTPVSVLPDTASSIIFKSSVERSTWKRTPAWKISADIGNNDDSFVTQGKFYVRQARLVI